MSLFRVFLLVLLVAGTSVLAQAQDFEINRYDVTAALHQATNTADLNVTLDLTNQSSQNLPARTLTLRINKNAKVSAATLNGTTIAFKQEDDPRISTLSVVTITLATPVAAGAKLEAKLQYSLAVKESNQYTAITPGDTLIFPESFWVPAVHTPLQPHGADTAPYTLNVTSDEGDIISDGTRKATGNTITFDSPLAGQPWLLVCPLAKAATRTVTVSGATATLSVATQPGVPGAEAQTQRLLDEMEKIVGFYGQTFGYLPASQFSVVSTPRNVNYVAPTTLVIAESAFRREAIDAETMEFLVRGTARAWLGGKFRLRGNGLGILQDALPSYLTALYLESRFGADAARQFWSRRVRAYAPLALGRNDAMLINQRVLDPDYFTSTLNKGALTFRLLERQMGRPALLEIIKKLLAGTGPELTTTMFRSLLTSTDQKADGPVARLLKQWWDEINEPDFIIGLPQKKEGGGWVCALRNFGTGDAIVPVLAFTDKGEKLTAEATVPSRGFSTVEFKTEATLVRVEVDPDKLYPQTRYDFDKSSTQFDNDSRPPRSFPFTLFREANTLFEQKDFAGVETKLKDALEQDPDYASSRILLARALAAQGKTDAAQAEMQKAMKVIPPPVYVLGWSAIVQADLAMAKKDAKAAVAAYRRAGLIDAEIACNLAARKGLQESEAAAQQSSQPDETIKSFIAQLDKAIKTGTTAALEPLVLKADLPQFVKGIVVSKPDNWTTQIVRSDVLDSQQVAVDVKMDVITADKKEQKGTAVFVLRKVGASWTLARIDLFTVQ
ncbi:MAG: tetratricopeptide repeat protein [Blastocatellia bacterium]|nr:tetratricopeptide repeat protein [Blastocatellia bacterium]